MNYIKYSLLTFSIVTLWPNHAYSQAMKLSSFGNANIPGQNRTKWGREKIELRTESRYDIQSSKQSQFVGMNSIEQDIGSSASRPMDNQQSSITPETQLTLSSVNQSGQVNNSQVTDFIDSDEFDEGLQNSLAVGTSSKNTSTTSGTFTHLKTNSRLSKLEALEVFNQVDSHFVENSFSEAWSSTSGSLRTFNYD